LHAESGTENEYVNVLAGVNGAADVETFGWGMAVRPQKFSASVASMGHGENKIGDLLAFYTAFLTKNGVSRLEPVG
jgi:hypothetical protein